MEKYLSADQLENLCRKEFNFIVAQNNKGALIFKFLQSKDQINWLIQQSYAQDYKQYFFKGLASQARPWQRTTSNTAQYLNLAF